MKMEDIAACSSLVFTVTRKVDDLIKALSIFQDYGIVLDHLESRPSKTPSGLPPNHSPSGDLVDYFVQFSTDGSIQSEELVERLKSTVISVALNSTSTAPATVSDTSSSTPWFPRTISEVQRCCTSLYKYGGELTSDHPGYGDEHYKQRRQEIAAVACQYEYGNPIPRLTYTKEEINTWSKVFTNQVQLYPTHACKEYNTHFPSLFEQCGYREDNIPQLEDVSRFLKSKTGWQLWPVIGWISSRDFLNTLAFRVFPTTQYIRHSSSPFYTPEPDICHELIGHAPLFCDPNYAQFSQDIGLASLGISDEWIEKLAALYWFTVEFGLVYEGGIPKAYGAGLLSGNEELQYCGTNRPERKTFEIEECLVTRYPETGLQPLYFVADSLEEMRIKMSEFAKSIPREFNVSYDHSKESAEITPKGCM